MDKSTDEVLRAVDEQLASCASLARLSPDSTVDEFKQPMETAYPLVEQLQRLIVEQLNMLITEQTSKPHRN